MKNLVYVCTEAHLCYEWNHKYMLVHCIRALHEKEKGVSFGKLLLSVPAALYSAMMEWSGLDQKSLSSLFLTTGKKSRFVKLS